MAHPEKIGKFPIVRTLGEGAMGVVYEGFDPLIRRPLAIKTIRRALLRGDDRSAEAIARFRTEAQAAGRLAHPNIASVYEYGEDDQCVYIAMEFVSGNTLREYIVRKTSFAEEDVLSIMSQLLDALGYAHSRKVLHRDIKPANLMISRDGRLKVTDFGIARIESTGLTQVGAVIGTPGYMAPEQFGGEDIDHRVDLYAAAATLYKLLSGELPFDGSMEQVMYKTVTSDPKPPSQVAGAERWRHFDEVALRGLARDRDLRFDSATAFRTALAALAQHPVAHAVSEHTLIMEPVRPFASAGTSSAFFSGTGTAGSSPGNWDPATLAKIESNLARHIGPMARVLVRRAAIETSDLVALRDRLATHLDNDAERSRFLESSVALMPRAMTSPATQTGMTSREASVAGAEWDPAMLAQIESKLVRFIGPMAKLMVRRAAGATRDFNELLAILAGQLGSEFEQRQFHASVADVVPRALAGRPAVAALNARASAESSGDWDGATLAQLEVRLARFIGPVAKVMVRRAAAQTLDYATLCDLIAGQLPVLADREAFLGAEATARRASFVTAARSEPGGTRVGMNAGAQAGTHVGTQLGTRLGTRLGTQVVDAATGAQTAGFGSSSAMVRDDPVDQVLLERAEQVLARRLGPISRVMVKRAAAQANTRGAFFQALVRLAGDATDANALMADLEKLPRPR